MASDFALQSATPSTGGGNRQHSLISATETNGQKVVSITATGSRAFFRLRGS